MFRIFYLKEEQIIKKTSLNDYEENLKEYKNNYPTLFAALYQMFFSLNISDQKAMELTYDILEKAKSIIKYNFDLIKEDYPYISEQEAIIISSYSCESIFPDYSPYKILNKNLNEEDRLKGIKNISKYLFIFLNSLRKLRKYYPKGKYMYRCINKKVNLEQDIFNNKISPIKKDDTLTTYGFISLTSEKNTIYNYKGKK